MGKLVTVYDFTVFNPVTGRNLRRGPATLIAIEKAGGEPLMETGKDVDESELDSDGYPAQTPRDMRA